MRCPQLPYGWIDIDLPNYRFPDQVSATKKTSVVCKNDWMPLPSGPFYCANGADRSYGRNIVEQHLDYCLYAGLQICGANAEVTPSQWEFQCGPLPGLEMGDHLWMARYILNRVAEEHGGFIEYAPKPMELYNGSGAHTNFSTNEMRNEGGYSKIIEACDKICKKPLEHLEEYGKDDNKERLTGKHETASWDVCNYGESDRSKSIRIPYLVHKNQKGYLEDRRPASMQIHIELYQ